MYIYPSSHDGHQSHEIWYFQDGGKGDKPEKPMELLDKIRLDKAKFGVYMDADIPLSNGQDLMDADKNGYKFETKAQKMP